MEFEKKDFELGAGKHAIQFKTNGSNF